MTREEARREIDDIDYYLQHHTDDYSESSHTAMMIAISALEQEPCDDPLSINSMVETIATKVTEDTEKFIFETIKPYCEEITKREISKKDLEQALTQYFSKEPCDEPAHYGDSTEKCKSCEYKRNTCDDLELEYEKTKALFSKIVKDDDTISREAVLKIIDGWYEQNRDTENIEDLIILITYMQSVQPSRKDNIECEWAKMTYDTDNKENKIMFEFSDGTKKRVTYTEEIKRTTVGE